MWSKSSFTSMFVNVIFERSSKNVHLHRRAWALVALKRDMYKYLMGWSILNIYPTNIYFWEHSSSMVECLTRDRGVAGLSLTNITALCR